MKTCNKCKSYKCTCQQKIVVSAEPQKIIERVIIESKPCPGPKGDTGDTGPRGPAGVAPNNYVSNVEIEGDSIVFTGVGEGFSGQIPIVDILGYSSLVITATQTGTSPLVSNILQNTTEVVIPAWVRNDSPIYYTIDLSGISGTIYINGLETSFNDNMALSKDIYDSGGTFLGRTVISLIGTTLFFSCVDDTNTLVDFSTIASSDTVIYFPEIRFYPL
jgi:hypothetical protein